MVIPHESVSSEALEGLLKEYCHRAWGLNDTESPEAERIAFAQKALNNGELVLWYSEYEESAYLLAANELPDLNTPPQQHE
ncbi:hypothetical protein A3742_08935 [Oleiphilus sp. HI0071]|jgi:uncharacterized protein YheU (UPF0270 family)|uniref:YheU family protein n=1 Tax=unclassified Oleiphilus TaxID=2631174 RepID=UPI0007C38E96|nr:MULTISPECIES: YheU family protein [unclassified Oleiphilus]KZY68909.1 hypothetical protein A3737_12530 [Oleiphilus sp. HI0065]KZY82644.1 hypothetical protein A3742_08935 [Oleiphilus sp. HI0071]KZY92639.1 hypothetical protein A3744_02790 [Oleiphilus sp. HI0073]KZZ44536.1 hypothetical protein A3758_14695 [Oleiphilus sp. HI0118]KZZ52987.1 hypothetical protein A3760_09750 [Oleiphilus sp. HI0122]KZZ68785.1 hypothetical protein A3765_04050 [Oleiphilus sp. HI0130]KZZ75705.1 hypothetical protein 